MGHDAPSSVAKFSGCLPEPCFTLGQRESRKKPVRTPLHVEVHRLGEPSSVGFVGHQNGVVELAGLSSTAQLERRHHDGPLVVAAARRKAKVLVPQLKAL